MIEKLALHPVYLRRLFAIRKKIYAKVGTLSVSYHPSREPIPFDQAVQSELRPIKIGQVWAREPFDCAWFHFTGKIPQTAKGQKTVD